MLGVDGQVYVCGTTFAGANYFDLVTLKYSPTGEALWTEVYDLPTAGGLPLPKLMVDESGSVYVSATTAGTGGDFDLLFLKYSVAGELLWERQYDTSGGVEYVVSAGLDQEANVVITSQSDFGFLTVKYDSAGSRLWARIYGGSGSGVNGPTDLSVSSLGEVFVGGVVLDTTGVAATAFAVVRYDNYGGEVWNWRYVHPGSDGNAVTTVVAGPDGCVYVSGWADMEPSDGINFDIITAKLDSGGGPEWVRQYSGPDPTWQDSPTDMKVADDGGVIITGSTGGMCLTLKYDAAGTEVWARVFTSGSGGQQIALDTAGSSCIACQNGLIVSYDTGGYQVWFRGLSGPGTLRSLGVDASGTYIHATGSIAGESSPDLVTVKFTTICSCPRQGDLDMSGANDAVDLALIIDAVFFGGGMAQDSTCPTARADYNVDFVVDAVDLALSIDHTFFGSSGPVSPCGE